MIGTNFRTYSDLGMQPFQKVYTTHNGREVSGYIQRYQGDQIFISIPGASEEKEIISKTPAEIRVDTRRHQKFHSATPMETAENGSQSYGRAVSESIAVPNARRIRRTSEEPTMNELMAAMVLSSLSSSPVFHNQPKGSPRSYDSSGVESWTQDSKHTSPSRQSSSRNTPALIQASEKDVKEFQENENDLYRKTPDDILDPDSDMILMQRSTPSKERDTKTVQMEEAADEPQDLSIPKSHLEDSSSKLRARTTPLSSFSDVGKLDVVMEHEESNRNERQPIVTMAMPIAIPPHISIPYYVAPSFFQQPFFGSLPAEFRVHFPSTPPIRTTEVGSSAPGHIDSKIHRYAHRTVPYHKVGDDSAVGSPSSSSPAHTYGSPPSSYYLTTTPIPVSSLSFSPSHHRKHTRSPLASKTPGTIHPSARVTQATPVSIPSKGANNVGYPVLSNIHFTASSNEKAVPGTKSFSWHSGAGSNFLAKPVIQPKLQNQPTSSAKTVQITPKSSIQSGRKPRSEGKCRKVYGMDHKDEWCTACRWKKACQRFPD